MARNDRLDCGQMSDGLSIGLHSRRNYTRPQSGGRRGAARATRQSAWHPDRPTDSHSLIGSGCPLLRYPRHVCLTFGGWPTAAAHSPHLPFRAGPLLMMLVFMSWVLRSSCSSVCRISHSAVITGPLFFVFPASSCSNDPAMRRPGVRCSVTVRWKVTRTSVTESFAVLLKL